MTGEAAWRVWRTVPVGLGVLWLCVTMTTPQGATRLASSRCYGTGNCSMHAMDCPAGHKMAMREATYWFLMHNRSAQCSGARVGVSQSDCNQDCCSNNGSDCPQNMTLDQLSRVRLSCSVQRSCSIRAQWGVNVQCGARFAATSTYSLLRADCIPEAVMVDPCTDVTVSGSLISVTYTRDSADNNGRDCKCRLDNNDASNSLNISVSAYDIDANESSVWYLNISRADSESPPSLFLWQNGYNVFPAADLSLVSAPLYLTFWSQGRDTRPQLTWLGFQVVGAVDTTTDNTTLRCGQHVVSYELNRASTTESTTTTPVATTTLTTTTTSTAFPATTSTTTPSTSVPTSTISSTVMRTRVTTTQASNEATNSSTELASSTLASLISLTTSVASSTAATTARTTATAEDTTTSKTEHAPISVMPSTTPSTPPSAAASTSVMALTKCTVANATSELPVAKTTGNPQSAANRYTDEVSEGLPVGAIVGIIVAVVVVMVLVVSLGVRFRRNCYDDGVVKVLPDALISNIQGVSWRQHRSEKRSLKQLSWDNTETVGWPSHRQRHSLTVMELVDHSAADNQSENSPKKGDNQTATRQQHWDDGAQHKAILQSGGCSCVSNSEILGKDGEGTVSSAGDLQGGVAGTLELSHPGSSSDGVVTAETDATNSHGSARSASEATLLNPESVVVRL